MSRIRLSICFLLVASATNLLAQNDAEKAEIDAIFRDDGSISILGTPTLVASGLVGVDLASSGGYLLPDSDPAPFGFLLSNTSSLVTYGSLGATAQFDMTDPDYPQGVIDLNVRYDLGSDPSAEDLVGRWGAPGDGNDGSISFPIVPEPTAHLMVVTALAALSLSRRRR